MRDWFDELQEFLRIPSVSADPALTARVREAGEWVCEFVRGAGGTAELLDSRVLQLESDLFRDHAAAS